MHLLKLCHFRYAHFALGQYQDAKNAFEKGLSFDPNNQAMKAALENTRNQLGDDNLPTPSSQSPPTGTTGASTSSPNIEDMMRNMGGGGGGMPDLAGMMNNPMMRQMAESLMANGGMERLMQNPAVANMVGIPYF
jgi:small glutamine-rich tetratricopeptide repeat-containing protein alpha